jgi:two-component system, OmpR family, alkaline phosphatase synthesis response regulator PhoP
LEIEYSTLLIVEDQKDLRDYMSESLSDAGYMIYKTGSVDMAISILKRQTIDVILLDLELEDGNGMDVLKFVRRQNDLIHVLIISSNSSLETRMNGFNEGTDDYILKPFHIEEVIARVHRTIRRINSKKVIETGLRKELQSGELVLDYQNANLKISGEIFEVRKKLFFMLEYFMKNEGVLINKRILFATLWNKESYFDENTLSVHIHQLRKLIDGNNPGPSYIQTVHGVGYRFISKK